MKSSELTSWVLTYLHMVCGLFTGHKHALNPARNLPGGQMNLDTVPLAVSFTLENAIGLLQNISLKPQGIDRILHFKPRQEEQKYDASGAAQQQTQAAMNRGPLNAVQIMQGLIDTASKLSKRQKQQMLEERPLLTLMASTYANSILYSLVTKSKGRSQARKSNLD